MRRDRKKNKEREVGRERRRRESMLISRELRRTDRQNVCTSSRENLGFDYHNAIFSIIRGFVFLRFNPVRCPLQGSVPYLYRGGFASGGLELVSYFTLTSSVTQKKLRSLSHGMDQLRK